MMRQTEWTDALPEGLPQNMARLLLRPSLTEALKQTGKIFTVELLLSDCFEGGAYGLPSDCMPEDKLFVREVLLKLDGRAVVRAHSVCAVDAEIWRKMLDCGNQPLGERLFDGTQQIQRSDFEFALFCLSDGIELPARRSEFFCMGQAMLLTEYFLPEMADCLT